MYAIRSYYGTKMCWIKAGSGVSLKLLKEKKADMIMVHAPAAEKKAVVITSYSIHYTKLYDTPREERRIAEVSLLYVTNWGELLFQEKMAGLHLLENKPFDFLRFNIPMELDPAPRIETS